MYNHINHSKTTELKCHTIKKMHNITIFFAKGYMIGLLQLVSELLKSIYFCSYSSCNFFLLTNVEGLQ